MRTYIKKLQSKPEHIRKQILVGTLIVAMSIVFMIWIGSLGYKFSSKKASVQVKEVDKPFTLLGQSITDTVKNVGASVGNVSLTPTGKQEETTENSQKIDLTPIENTQVQQQIEFQQ